MIARLLALGVNRPRATLAVVLALTLIAAWLVSRTRVASSLEAMLGEDSEAAGPMIRVMRNFSTAQDLLVVARAEGADAGGALESFARRFEVAARDRASIARVRWRSDLLGNGAAATEPGFARDVVLAGAKWRLSDERFDELRRRLTLDSMREQIRRDEALVAAPGVSLDALLQDPLRLREFLAEAIGEFGSAGSGSREGAFFSRDGGALLLHVAGTGSPTDLRFARALTRDVEALAREAGARVEFPLVSGRPGETLEAPGAGIRATLSGPHPIAARAESAMRRDMIMSILGSCVLLGLVFFVGYSRPRAGLVAGASVGVGILWAFGLHALIEPTLTPATGVLGAILAGLGVDYAIHVLSHLDASSRAAAPRRLARLAPALAGAGITSIIAFLAASASSVAMVRGFGRLGALGLGCTLVAALLIAPAITYLGGAGRSPREPRSRAAGRVLDALERGRRVLVAFGACGVLGAGVVVATGPVVRFDDDLHALHPRPNPPLDALAEIAREFDFSPDAFIVHVTASGPRELLSLSHRVDACVREAGEDLSLISCVGPASFLPDPARDADRTLDAERVVADFRLAIDESVFDPGAFDAYARFLRELASRDEPPGIADLARFQDVASICLPGREGVNEALVLVSSAADLSSREARARVTGALRAAVAHLPGVSVTGMNVVTNDMDRVLRADLRTTCLLAGASVLVVLVVLFRRPADVARALVPVVSGAIVLLAYLRLADERLNALSLVSLPLLAGFAVDQGIFVASAGRLARRDREAARESLASSLHALLMCSATTILAFGSLIASGTPAIASLGRVTGVGLAASFAATIVLLVPMTLRGMRAP